MLEKQGVILEEIDIGIFKGDESMADSIHGITIIAAEIHSGNAPITELNQGQINLLSGKIELLDVLVAP